MRVPQAVLIAAAKKSIHSIDAVVASSVFGFSEEDKPTVLTVFDSEVAGGPPEAEEAEEGPEETAAEGAFEEAEMATEVDGVRTDDRVISDPCTPCVGGAAAGFFSRNEESFRGMVHPACVADAYAAVGEAAQVLVDTVASDLPEGSEVVHDAINNGLYFRKSQVKRAPRKSKQSTAADLAAESAAGSVAVIGAVSAGSRRNIPQYEEARDRNRRLIAGRQISQEPHRSPHQ